MTNKQTDKRVEEAVDSFDVAEWLSGVTSAKDTVTIYRDGEALKNLQKLQNYVDQMKSKSEEEQRQLIRSIGDETEPFQLDASVRAEIEELNEKLKSTALTFEVTSITPKEVDLISKKVAKSLKSFKDEDGNEQPGGADHPDYADRLSEAYIARMIVDTTDADGNSVKKTWTVNEVAKLRGNKDGSGGLPGREFSRLESKVVEMAYLRYDVDSIIDRDFS